MDEKYQQDYDLLLAHAKKAVPQSLQQPRSFIHYPFIDPSSVYDGNVWDWDTYWVVYALLSVMDLFPQEMQDKIITHAKGNVKNFMDHQLEDGYIPMMIEVAKWTEPYLNMRHKEGVRMNMHKPFLCGQICEISDYIGDFSWAEPFLENLRRYFQCYETYYHADKGLYVWHDDIMIGMDNDPASFGRPHDSTANIFLNSFMVRELECMERLCGLWHTDAVPYTKRRESLIRAIQEECWDVRDRFFYSVDVDVKLRPYDWFHQGLGVFWKTLPIKVQVWSGFIPMWAGFATKEQAEALEQHWKNDNTFHTPYGVATLAKDEKMFNLEATNNPSNWLGGIWLVASYVVFRGMLDYGYTQSAVELCRDTLELLGNDLKKSGNLHEYYNSLTGEPVTNSGFLNWNLLALTMVRELKKQGIEL